MFVKNREMYAVKRYLLKNKGMVMPFSKEGTHETLGISNFIVHKALRTLASKGYLEQHGAWQHVWFFVTEEGNENLNEEVGLDEEMPNNELETLKI